MTFPRPKNKGEIDRPSRPTACLSLSLCRRADIFRQSLRIRDRGGDGGDGGVLARDLPRRRRPADFFGDRYLKWPAPPWAGLFAQREGMGRAK